MCAVICVAFEKYNCKMTVLSKNTHTKAVFGFIYLLQLQ